MRYANFCLFLNLKNLFFLCVLNTGSAKHTNVSHMQETYKLSIKFKQLNVHEHLDLCENSKMK